MLRHTAPLALASLLIVAACSHKKPETAPAPTPVAQAPGPNADSIAREQARRDSLARLAADSARRAEAAAAAARARETLTARVYFDYDKADLRDDARASLDQKIPILQQNGSITIRVEGNADERGSEEYNLALGQRRAAAAKRYLTDRGIDGSRITVISYGLEHPVCTEHEESCWAQNRRDDFTILGGMPSITMQ